MHSLPIFVRLTGRRVILIGEGYMADAKARLIERAGAIVVDEGQEAALAFVALADPAEAAKAATRLKARGLLVNVVDRLDLCDFTMPAIVDRDPVLIAIGTGGASAGLAAALRQRLETMIPASLGGIAAALGRVRQALKMRIPDYADRRRFIAALVAPGGPLDPLVEIADPDARIAGTAVPEAGRIEHAAIASDDPDALTLRAARLLGLADRIYHPPGMADAILDRARADAERFVGDAPPTPLPGLSVVLTRAAA